MCRQDPLGQRKPFQIPWAELDPAEDSGICPTHLEECRNLIKNPRDFIRVPYMVPNMNPTILGL